VLRLRLLGDVAVQRGDGPPEAFGSSRLQSMVAFLVLHRGAPQPRERLAFLLWSDSTDKQARSNLRKLLYVLRRTLPEADGLVEVTHSTLQWRPGAPAEVDVVVFEDALAAARRAGDEAAGRRHLDRAVSAYGGPLLPSSYEDWVLAERDRLHAGAVEALERLLALAESDTDDGALRYGEELLRLEPLRESAYRQLMRLRARRGERAEALRVYRACEAVLARELGVAPSERTRTLHDELVRAGGPPPGVELPRGVAPAPLVGRDAAWKELYATWQAAATGRPQVVVVTGEAGIGKSRLLEELGRVVASEGGAVARARAYEAEGRLAWGPVVDWLRCDPIRRYLRGLAPMWRTELVRLLPELRSPELADPAGMEHAQQRAHLFRAVTEAMQQVDVPLLLVLDDLQWCDDDTVAFVHFLVRDSRPARLLVAASLRPEDVAPGHPALRLLDSLEPEGRAGALALDRLDEAATVELARQLCGRELDAATGRRLYEETQGNPHFVVETVRAGLPQDPEGLARAVQPVLQRRLRRLSAQARAVVETAAVVGVAFDVDLLAGAGPFDRATLLDTLDELWRHHVVQQRGTGYDFDHDRLREVAYAMISPARRQGLHRAVARALEQLHGQHLGPVSARLAVHYEHAGLLWEAVAARRHAIDHALHLLAIDEAQAETRRALDLLEQLPAGPERDELELEVRMAEAVSTVIRSGYGDPAVTRTYERVLALARHLGQPPPSPALRGLALAAVVSCRFDRAQELGEQLLDVARERAVQAEGHYVLGVCAHWRGDLAAARDHLDEAVQRSDRAPGPAHLSRYAQDPEAVCRSRLAWTLWCLGDTPRAVATMRHAQTLAEQGGHPLTSAYVNWIAATLALELGNEADLRGIHDSSLEAWGINPVFADVVPAMFGGWLRVLAGEPDGLHELSAAVETSRRPTHALYHTYALSLLARAQLAVGRTDSAADVLGEALALTEARDQRYLEAELHRLVGEAAAGHGDGPAADRAFERALDVAAGQGARAYELRAACSLVRHRHDAGTVARLRRAYGAVDASHATEDTRTAATLLAARD
jgi:DNA-binding SARP family transcriptional activator/tetratricopeptide (TPR) repeat protein